MLHKEETTWFSIVGKLMKEKYMLNILKFITKELKKNRIFPEKEHILYALQVTPFNEVKVVILGQDPYHKQGQATGLAFSVHKNTEIPKTLHNIFLELCDDLKYTYPTHGCLLKWAQQGVLLLNSVLTVTENKANSHSNIGWEHFTNSLIKKISDGNKKRIIFVLWGERAKHKKIFINTKKHCIIESSHPSPLSAYNSFFGSKCFSRINKLLHESGQKEIDWRI